MSTGIIKYYPESSESSYVSISFAWIKDQRLQGWNSETHFELVILGSFMTFPCTTELTQPWTWGLFPHGGGVDGQTFPQVPKMWMPRGKHTRSCNNGNMRHQDSEKSQSGTLDEFKPAAPVPGWEWSLIHQGWPFGGDGFLTFHLDPLIQQNWSLVEWIPASPTMVISRWLLPGESSCVHGWSRREVAFDVCIELHFGHDSPGESGVGNAVKGEKQPNHLRFYYYTILVCCTSFLSLWLNDPYQGVSRNIDLP